MFLENIFEFLFGLGLFINALLFIPQSIKLIKVKHANEISAFTFLGFFLIQTATLIHGFIHHDQLLVMGMLLSMLTCGSVIFLTIFYKLKSKRPKNL